MSCWAREDVGVGEGSGLGNRMGVEVGAGVDVVPVDGMQAGTKAACEAAYASPAPIAHANKKNSRNNTTETTSRYLRVTTEGTGRSGRHGSSSLEVDLYFIEVTCFDYVADDVGNNA
jgi:hypothetical protein